MPLDLQQVAAAFRFDPQQVGDLRERWARLMERVVWGDLKSSKIGGLPRLRKRVLELGENLRSVVADRAWIPQAREQVKGAMGASIKLRDSLLDLERAAQLIDSGADFARFETELLAFRAALLRFMEHHESQWAALLEGLYEAEPPDEADP
ncbi:MAG: hypothetical protein B7Z66_09045 [Chromatiales bacterium 21-64-14]|nr:MAG: hypothetical protein B7Z66_09045 [Chromatiales bacterium 21-64-14]HQU15257.1 hypothetical protein [Gammaproteobacteria bacterium]